MLNLSWKSDRNCHQPNLHAGRETLRVTNWQTVAQGVLADSVSQLPLKQIQSVRRSTFSFCVCTNVPSEYFDTVFHLSFIVMNFYRAKCAEHSSNWNLSWITTAIRRNNAKFARLRDGCDPPKTPTHGKTSKLGQAYAKLSQHGRPSHRKWINLNENRAAATCVEMTSLFSRGSTGNPG